MKFIRALAKSACLIVLFGHFGATNAQTGDNFIKRTVRQLLFPKGDSVRKAGFTALPAIGYTQETRLEYGAIGTY